MLDDLQLLGPGRERDAATRGLILDGVEVTDSPKGIFENVEGFFGHLV
jgi:hypothetical protein